MQTTNLKHLTTVSLRKELSLKVHLDKSKKKTGDILLLWKVYSSCIAEFSPVKIAL